MNKKIILIVGAVIYLVTSFGSYKYFSANTVDTSEYEAPVVDADGNVVDTAPKTEECPLNGKMYSKNQRAKWEKRRPLGIMVQNNTEARPQSGLSSADIVHEAVAEGGITRFLVMYYCDESKIVGSVRSARIYFIRLLQGYGNNPLYGHVGGANTPGPADALGEIKKLGWFGYNDMDQFAVPFPNYWRDYDRLPGRATEHTVYTNTLKLWDYAAKNRDLTNVDEDGVAWDEDWEPWNFQDDAKEGSRGDVAKINYDFWDNNLGSAYTVQWNYDAVTNSYKRVNGGDPHVDKNTEEQLASKNVIVAFANESVANDGYEHGEHMLYDVIGSDDAIIFQNGEAIEGTWKKPKATDMMRFYDSKGKEIDLVRGQIWISILPSGNKVTY
ncbi:DUF3048 domain-containing protein [Candidatus Roizmanbacteria bacterium]|nr:MAG: DUF3048 domain-containing protein [Candidatus Roizmanbacteria bacterium]